MGDTGSMGLGGAPGCSIMTKTEGLVILIGGIFVIEALSVIVQVATFAAGPACPPHGAAPTPLRDEGGRRRGSRCPIAGAIFCACAFVLYYRYFEFAVLIGREALEERRGLLGRMLRGRTRARTRRRPQPPARMRAAAASAS